MVCKPFNQVFVYPALKVSQLLGIFNRALGKNKIGESGITPEQLALWAHPCAHVHMRPLALH